MVLFAAFLRPGGLGRRVAVGTGVAGIFLFVFWPIAVTVAIAVTIFAISITISPSLYISTVQDSSQKLTAGLLDLIERLLDQAAGSCTCTYHQDGTVSGDLMVL